eukprot:TRINITY_DN3535_c0_g1_i1.p1 TRINITY_DN3535_c0_g1~~TRINITY_DN3535_c0_g1_i1.p1  ORF type:complete len:245 (-),score=38.21 TRINITY_DN3535_c0_g1_i1:47-781(-)
MSGSDREEMHKIHRDWTRQALGISDDFPVNVFNDALAALLRGTQGELHGIVVISGTGTIVFGHHNGVQHRALGYGPSLGDKGSGYAIANDMFIAVVKAEDKMGPETKLTQRLYDKLNFKTTLDLTGWVYADSSWERVASLYPIVADCYLEDHDEVAEEILDQNVETLFTGIRTVIKRLGFEPSETFPIVFSGGVLTHEKSVVAEKLQRKLVQHYPRGKIIYPTLSAELAAAIYAAKLSADALNS